VNTNLFISKNAKLLFLGLDNAGKSTLLHMMKSDKMATVCPTLHPHCEELMIHNVRCRTYDLGGHETARVLWKNYAALVDAVLFIVDASDSTRFGEAREELSKLFKEEALQGVPFVVFGNKIDKYNAVSEEELRSTLGLPHHCTHGKDANVRKTDTETQPIEVFMGSILKRTGYAEAFQWLSSFLN